MELELISDIQLARIANLRLHHTVDEITIGIFYGTVTVRHFCDNSIWFQILPDGEFVFNNDDE